MEDKEFDNLLGKAANLYMDGLDIPAEENAWRRLKASLELIEKEKRRAALRKRLAVAAAIIIVTAGSLTAAGEVAAVNPRIWRMITTVWNKTVRIVVDFTRGKNNGDTLPETPQGNPIELPNYGGITRESVALEDAVNGAEFTVLLPGYLPDDIVLKEVIAYAREGGPYFRIDIQYAKNEKQLLITEEFLPGDYSEGIHVYDEDTEVRNLTINGREALLLVFDDAYAKLRLIDEGIRIVVEGNLRADEIVKIAEGLQ